MEDQNSIIVGSLHVEIWRNYLENFTHNECKKLLTQDVITPGLNIVRDELKTVDSLAGLNPSAQLILIYWPLELFPYLTQNCSLEPSLVQEWNHTVSQYLTLKRKYGNRLKLVNGLHLFPEFLVDDVPSQLCSFSPLTEIVAFYKIVFAKDGALEFPNYAENLDALHASESNPSHSAYRAKQFMRLKAEALQDIHEGERVKPELIASNLETKELNDQLRHLSQEKLIANKEVEQLKQQVLLLQNALESQYAKVASLVNEHQSVLKEQENKLLEKTNVLKAEIDSLNKELSDELQKSYTLTVDIQDKEKKIIDLERKVNDQRKQNESLQEHLVQAQIHIEKTHQTLYSRLNEAESKFSSERKALTENLSKLALELESSQQSIVSLKKEHQEQIKAKDGLYSQLNEAESKFSSERKALTENLSKLELELESSQQSIVSLKKEHQQQIKAKDTHIKNLTESKDGLLNEISHERETLKAVNRNLDAKKKALLHEKKQRQRVEQKLATKLEKLEQALSISESKRNILEYEFSQVKNSKYWKLLAPARSIKGRLFNTDKEMKKDIALLYTSNLFDAKWYLESYEDVVASGLDPAEHYLKFGFKEGRQPGPNFDGNWYLRHYSDVAKKGANPLIHFIKFGQAEGRCSAPRLLGSS